MPQISALSQSDWDFGSGPCQREIRRGSAAAALCPIADAHALLFTVAKRLVGRLRQIAQVSLIPRANNIFSVRPSHRLPMSPTPHALEIINLKKTFAEPAVDGLSLQIKRGEFYALLGPNGAGKTTTLRMVAGLLVKDAGNIKVCGIDTDQDPIAAKHVMAWVPDEPMIYDKLTPLEYLAFVAGLWNMDADVARLKAVTLLDQFGLGAHGNERCQGFSKGMRQKVALAGALIHDPKLIILDEPLTGLDAGSARLVKSVLQDLVAGGVTVIMTTHILEVAERMADRIGVIAKGKLIAQGTLDELRQTSGDTGKTLEDIFLEIVKDGDDQTDVDGASSNEVKAA